jgi:acyl-CoA thioesterase-2
MSEALERAQFRSLEGLLRALDLEEVERDVFKGVNEPARFPRVFGGQLAAQAMQAASLTVAGNRDVLPHSIHATYARSGDVDLPVRFVVERVRDGRTTATRQVTASQGDRSLLVATVSFHANGSQPAAVFPDPVSTETVSPGPAELPTVGDWAAMAPPHLAERARGMWIEMAPPLDVRVGEAFTFLGGPQTTGSRSHWMKVPWPVADDPVRHTVLLTYASDYFLLDMAVRNHPQSVVDKGSVASTLDHSLYLHRPVRFDRWHLYTQDLVSVYGTRGLVVGSVHDEDGALVATTAQQVLVPLPGQ